MLTISGNVYVSVFVMNCGLTYVMDGTHNTRLVEYLSDYAHRADEYLDKFWSHEEDRLHTFEVSVDIQNRLKEMTVIYRTYMEGGKKLRGALVQLGFECGAENKDLVLPFSLGMEVLHSFMLMHDDVMDRDMLRRNKPTVHAQYAAMGNQFSHPDPVHFGNSMAIVLGDLGCFWGAGLLSENQLPAERVLAGMRYLWNFLLNTGYGQALDVWNEMAESIDESLLMQVHLHKTAYYTIAGPLQYGGILAGVDQDRLDAMEEYGKAVGVAFQLRDDELGLFGDEQKLGKPIGSDIKAGKNTLLKIKALELSSVEDQEFLKKAYGNQEVTEDMVERVRVITRSSGALAYSESKCQELVEKGKSFIAKITGDAYKQQLLTELADYIYSRGK